MKNLILAIVILVIGIGLIMESRYEIKIHSPVVAKLDRFTGDVWIVNSGVWRKIELPSSEAAQETKAVADTPAAEAK